MNGQWFEDDTVKVECSDDDDTTTTAHPTGQSISEPIFSLKNISEQPVELTTFTFTFNQKYGQVGHYLTTNSRAV